MLPISSILDIYQNSPTPDLTKTLARNISIIYNSDNFYRLSPDLIFNILAECEPLTMEISQQIIANIQHKYNLDLDKILERVNCRDKEVLKRDKSNFNQTIQNINDKIFSIQSDIKSLRDNSINIFDDKILKLNEKIDYLENKFKDDAKSVVNECISDKFVSLIEKIDIYTHKCNLLEKKIDDMKERNKEYEDFLLGSKDNKHIDIKDVHQLCSTLCKKYERVKSFKSETKDRLSSQKEQLESIKSSNSVILNAFKDLKRQFNYQEYQQLKLRVLHLHDKLEKVNIFDENNVVSPSKTDENILDTLDKCRNEVYSMENKIDQIKSNQSIFNDRISQVEIVTNKLQSDTRTEIFRSIVGEIQEIKRQISRIGISEDGTIASNSNNEIIKSYTKSLEALEISLGREIQVVKQQLEQLRIDNINIKKGQLSTFDYEQQLENIRVLLNNEIHNVKLSIENDLSRVKLSVENIEDHIHNSNANGFDVDTIVKMNIQNVERLLDQKIYDLKIHIKELENSLSSSLMGNIKQYNSNNDIKMQELQEKIIKLQHNIDAKAESDNKVLETSSIHIQQLGDRITELNTKLENHSEEANRRFRDMQGGIDDVFVKNSNLLDIVVELREKLNNIPQTDLDHAKVENIVQACNGNTIEIEKLRGILEDFPRLYNTDIDEKLNNYKREVSVILEHVSTKASIQADKNILETLQAHEKDIELALAKIKSIQDKNYFRSDEDIEESNRFKKDLKALFQAIGKITIDTEGAKRQISALAEDMKNGTLKGENSVSLDILEKLKDEIKLIKSKLEVNDSKLLNFEVSNAHTLNENITEIVDLKLNALNQTLNDRIRINTEKINDMQSKVDVIIPQTEQHQGQIISLNKLTTDLSADLKRIENSVSSIRQGFATVEEQTFAMTSRCEAIEASCQTHESKFRDLYSFMQTTNQFKTSFEELKSQVNTSEANNIKEYREKLESIESILSQTQIKSLSFEERIIEIQNHLNLFEISVADKLAINSNTLQNSIDDSVRNIQSKLDDINNSQHDKDEQFSNEVKNVHLIIDQMKNSLNMSEREIYIKLEAVREDLKLLENKIETQHNNGSITHLDLSQMRKLFTEYVDNSIQAEVNAIRKVIQRNSETIHETKKYVEEQINILETGTEDFKTGIKDDIDMRLLSLKDLIISSSQQIHTYIDDKLISCEKGSTGTKVQDILTELRQNIKELQTRQVSFSTSFHNNLVELNQKLSETENLPEIVETNSKNINEIMTDFGSLVKGYQNMETKMNSNIKTLSDNIVDLSQKYDSLSLNLSNVLNSSGAKSFAAEAIQQADQNFDVTEVLAESLSDEIDQNESVEEVDEELIDE